MNPADLFMSEAGPLDDAEGDADTGSPPPTSLSNLNGMNGTTTNGTGTKLILKTSGTTSGNAATAQRIDTESVYTRLKAAIGPRWEEYKDALGTFLLGKINQTELTRTLGPILSFAPIAAPPDSSSPPTSTLHLHNCLITAIYANALYRDAPSEAIAPWVTATDAPTASIANKAATDTAGGGASDKVEERIKKEVMALSARDRRRIKAVRESPSAIHDDNGLLSARTYRDALEPVASTLLPATFASGTLLNTANPTTAGSKTLAKTNFDLEIKRRFATPLACESLEFPAKSEIQARLDPLCFQEGLTSTVPSTTASTCAELVEIAAEIFVKEMLENWFSVVRADSTGLVQTAAFKTRLRHEERVEESGPMGQTVKSQGESAKINGRVEHISSQGLAVTTNGQVHIDPASRNALGLLPAEAEVVAGRDPLAIEEVRLALQLDGQKLRLDPFLAQEILVERYIDHGHGHDSLDTLMGGVKTNGILDPATDTSNMDIDASDTAQHTLASAREMDLNAAASTMNGTAQLEYADPMILDEKDWGWDGAGVAARGGLMNVLKGVLAVGP